MPLEESHQFLFFSIVVQNAREAISNAGPYFIFRLFQLQTSPINCKLSEKPPWKQPLTRKNVRSTRMYSLPPPKYNYPDPAIPDC